MAFIYEINGQQVEFDREPTDADIDEAARSLGQPSGGITEMLTPPIQAQDYAVPQAAMSGARPAMEAAKDVASLGVGLGKNVLDIGKNALNWTPEAWKQVITNPVSTAKAYAMHHPVLSQGVGGMAGGMARGLGQVVGSAATAPENLFTAPYTMAAYEQEKIRQNPTAPGLEYNPYAQTVRGEFPTQQSAAAANRRRAIASQTYGGLSPQEQQILDADQQLSYAIRLKAAKKVLGQP